MSTHVCTPLPPHLVPLVINNKKPPGKGRGRGKKPASPHNLSVKSLTNKKKPRPRTSSSGRELLEGKPLGGKSDLQHDMDNIQENLTDCLNCSNTTVAEDATAAKPETLQHVNHVNHKDLTGCSNSSNRAVVAVIDTQPATNSVIPSVLTSDTSIHAIPANDVQCFNSSNIETSVADVPLENAKSSLVLTCNTGNQALRLNSSNNEELVTNPPCLHTLVSHYLLMEFKLCGDQLDNLLKCRTPACLTVLSTSALVDKYPGLNIDLALMNLTKYKIVNSLTTVDQQSKEGMPSLDLDAFLKTLALKRKMEVLVPKVGWNTVNRWTKKVPHWSLLDPYSDLEDEVSSTPTNEDTVNSENGDSNSGVHFTQIGGHVLRYRTHSYCSDRTCCSETKFTFYRGMCTTSKDSKVKPKRKPKIVPLKHLSASRLESQDHIRNGRITDANRLIRSYPLFSLSKNDSDSECEIKEPVVSDSDTIPYVPELEPPVFEESKHTSPPTKKGKLVTKMFGVKKPGKNVSSHKYTCPKCKGIYDSIALLNRHFKDTHPPLQCKICDKYVNTPSTLTRHMYSHKELKFSCDFCPKKFTFESDCDTHHISHRKIKTFLCNKPKCGKSFFFEGDLTKHVKTHQKKISKV